jgi:hypothetical protein
MIKEKVIKYIQYINIQLGFKNVSNAESIGSLVVEPTLKKAIAAPALKPF